MENLYNKNKLFVNFINENYCNNKKILDVGSGKGITSLLLSNLGYRVDSMDKFSINTKLLLGKYNINTIDEYFDVNTDITNYDLIVGLHCCSAIEKIIINATKYNKEFCVTVCETRKDITLDYHINDREDYLNYLKSLNNNILVEDLPIFVDKENWGRTLYYKK